MLKQLAARVLPPRAQVPVRYWYRALRGGIDPEVATLCDAVRPGSVALDIGGNVGCYTYALSRCGADLHTFEPLPDCAGMLEAFGKATVHRVALSDHEGTETLYIPHRDGRPISGWATFTKPSGPHDTLPVPVRTLDSYEFRNVSVIKIDVEGHEMAVIRGGADTIRSQRPVLLVEIEERHHGRDIRPFLREIEEMGYRGTFGDACPVSVFDPKAHQQSSMADQGNPRYFINFFFRPR